ncbi:MAG: MBL fold metallo-hydrolase [Clostridium lundense]|nr:MBL fold metallo-hydrolase [Clostridium lundense]
MELTKIKGNTYYIDAPTNIGVYVFKNKNCLLVDTGMNNSSTKKIDEVLAQNGLHPKYIINTHSHLDHCGGNTYFQNNYPGCLVYSSLKEKLFMENQELHASILSTGNPFKGLDKSNKSLSTDFLLEYGTNKINDEKLEVISLKGHSIEQIGIITPEKVCFLGDSLFSDTTIDKYSLPYLYDIEDSLNTLNFIKEIDADYFVVGHSDKIYEKLEITQLAEKNIENINRYLNDILELLDQPLSKEDVLENLALLNNLDMEFRQYHLNLSAVSSFLSYLYNNGKINSSVQDGKLYFYV